MRLELAERLICPSAHEATPLIVLASETSGRDLRRAQLGCMLCRREGTVRDGSVSLTLDGSESQHAAAMDATIASAPEHPGSDTDVLRLAALLGLTEANELILLGPRLAAVAPALAERHDAIVAVYAAEGASPPGVGYVRVTERRVPFAAGTFAAAALDTSMDAETTADALRCVRAGGRIVGEAALPVPRGVRELARDEDGWVGELESASSPIIPLRRA